MGMIIESEIICQDRYDAKNLDEWCKQKRIKQRLIM